MFRFQKKKCTNEIMGKVIKKRWNGNIWFLTAEYIVEGKTYKRTEQLRYQKVKTHKIANVPIGMVSQEEFTVEFVADNGTADFFRTFVRIKYNPQKPKKSYMPDNDGMLLT